jgi:hypothetical protein
MDTSNHSQFGGSMTLFEFVLLFIIYEFCNNLRKLRDVNEAFQLTTDEFVESVHTTGLTALVLASGGAIGYCLYMVFS